MGQLERISFTLPPDLLAQLDDHLAAAGHGNRSELIRDALRERLVRHTGPDVPVTASLTVVFDHSQRSLGEGMVAHAHDHGTLVVSTLHVHVDAHRCMEVSVLRGRRSALQHYADHVLGMKGVLHGELVLSVPV